MLKECKTAVESQIDAIVARFYQLQTDISEISLLIGDADTLRRLQTAQRKYVLDLFSGLYDLEYVNNRLRIGLVHKRIGVEPKLYLSAISTLKSLLTAAIRSILPKEIDCQVTLDALDKLFLFDITLVFETYIRSLVSEIETSREKSEHYAQILEEKVLERTQQLEELTRVDSLTGLLNVRYLSETATRVIRAAQRRSEPVSVVYMDIDNFKTINDTQGHQRGDEILRVVGGAIKKISRVEDSCFRYGGDEFCSILPNCYAEQAKEFYLHRLDTEIKKQLNEVTLSIGIMQTGPNEYEEPDTLIRQADEKMYAAKKFSKTTEKFGD